MPPNAVRRTGRSANRRRRRERARKGVVNRLFKTGKQVFNLAYDRYNK